MRIMFDTNILISAIIFSNDAMDLLMSKASLSYQIVLSSYIIDELLDVAVRKFPNKVRDIDRFLTRLPYELVYTPREIPHNLFAIRDVDDYPVLYSAIIGNVDIFVTGDNDFLEVEIDGLEIITPSTFLKKY